MTVIRGVQQVPRKLIRTFGLVNFVYVRRTHPVMLSYYLYLLKTPPRSTLVLLIFF